MEQTNEKMEIATEIQDELEIDSTDLNAELVRQSSKYFYWGTCWALAAQKARLKALKTKGVEAKLSKEFRKLMTSEDPKTRVTEKMINEHLSEHPEYLEACNDEIEAEYMADMLAVGKDAFKQRGISLLELVKAQREDQFSANEFKTFKTELEERDTRKSRKTKGE